MKFYIIAWRNIWRNKKRTLITISAVLFAVLLSTFMSSMQEGTYSNMIQNTVSYYSGYLQIQDSNFWDTRSINDIYSPSDEFISKVENTPNISLSFPRLESFTLLSTGENTKAGALIGIDPVKENSMTNLSHWVIEGKYLEPGDEGMLLSVNLAKQLNATIGDTLIFMSMGYHGASAADLVPVQGILKFPSPTLNSLGAYVDITLARRFFSAEDRVTSTVIMIDDYKKLNMTKHDLTKQLDGHYKIMTWKEMSPELVQMIQQDRLGAVIFKFILYLIIGFGILGTVIMMMSERKKELGIMIAVGMQKKMLKKILFYETLYVGFIGVVIGFIVSIPVIMYLVGHPIPLPAEMAEAYEKFGFEANMYFSMFYKVFVNQVLSIFVISLVVYIYPFFNISKMKVSKVLHS